MTNVTEELASEGATIFGFGGIEGLLITLGIIFGVFLVVLMFWKFFNRDSETYSGGESINKIRKPRKLYSQTFNKNKFKNFCGVEIECIQDNYNLCSSDAGKLNFKKMGDGSLSSGGEEFVSKPSNGDRLFNMIDKICKVLNEKEYFIDKTCGLHVHIEIPMKLELIKKLYIFYSKYENFFFKMLPSSRQKSDYCEKIRRTDNFSIKDVKNMTSLHQFKKKYYETNFYGSKMEGHYYKKRYCWTNFHSLFYRGTLEVRSHSGTINSDKIKNWIKIHLSVIDFIKDKSVEEVYLLPVEKESFMKIFSKDIRKYINSRWGKFKKTEEEYKCAKYK